MTKVNNKNPDSNHTLGIHICNDLSIFVEHGIALNNRPHSTKFSGYSNLHTIDDPDFLVKFNKYLEKQNQGTTTILDVDKLLDNLLAE